MLLGRCRMAEPRQSAIQEIKEAGDDEYDSGRDRVTTYDQHRRHEIEQHTEDRHLVGRDMAPGQGAGERLQGLLHQRMKGTAKAFHGAPSGCLRLWAPFAAGA